MENNEKDIEVKKDKKEQKAAIDAMKEILLSIKRSGLVREETEDDLHKAFKQETCPHNLCDGRGYTKIIQNGKTLTSRCQCYKDYQLKKRLEVSGIPANLTDVKMDDLTKIDDKIHITHLKPKAKQSERKIDGRKKNPDPETPDEFVARSYDTKDMRGVHFFTSNYCQKILSLLNENPRKQTLNLMLMGDPGKGKTYLACAVAKEFMKQGKSVYFTTMRALIDEAFESKQKIRHLVRTKDLVIIDELGQEYHTDTKYALKLIQDIFKERQETRLPIICTTNSYPNELEDYYEGSLMSTFNGRFLMMMMHGEYDLRILEANKRYEELDFLD